jgi:uncharacterized protein
MKTSPAVSPLLSAQADHIPVIWTEPETPPTSRRLAIWLPYFTGTKEVLQPQLQDLARAGFVALSFDPWQHGVRGTESPEALSNRVFGDTTYPGNFRRHMWPILGQTTLDALRVMDWAISTLEVSAGVFFGGFSMGGDIAVAVAGVDTRVACVAAVVATPDWLRPGMRDYAHPDTVVAPGEADAYATFFYNQLNPLTHLPAYARCPAITFECGETDTHVPPAGALRFQAALSETYRACPERLRVNLHAGVGHTTTPAMWQNCLAWFSHYSSESAKEKLGGQYAG